MERGYELTVRRIPLNEIHTKRSYIVRTEQQKLRDEIASLKQRAAGMQTQLEELNCALSAMWRRIAEKMTELAKLSA